MASSISNLEQSLQKDRVGKNNLIKFNGLDPTMNASKNLETQIIELKSLLASLQKANTYADKLAILNSLPIVKEYLDQSHPIQSFIKNLTPEAEYTIKSIIAIGQAPIVFKIEATTLKERFNRLILLLEQLLEIEIFYQQMGGIIGYHLTVISLIISHQKKINLDDTTRYIHPEGLYLGREDSEVRQAVRWGIENIKNIGMIYPLGGAGDRLNLTDDATGTPLPAARLPFLGRTLLEGLIRDLQAMEYLYFKLFDKQLLTPIAVMTSVEKNNHVHILKICKSKNWFGRPPESFYFFIQPVVPVITIDGNWSLAAPLTLTLKPCGHGILWKLAEEQGVLNWLESQDRHQCLIRQINNPIAGTDNCLLALIGIGCHDHKAFGFASCERLLKSDEGTNVLIENKKDHGYDYCLTNIEYTDFTQKGIEEIPSKPGSPFSIYPTNTNILFADIPAIRKLLKICPIPGQLINMKSKVSYIDSEGHQSFVLGGRLESTMQNIADYIVDHFPTKLNQETLRHSLRTFIVYNDRSKIISTTKKSYKPGESPISTPEQAYYDLLSNHYKLLQQCQFELPEWTDLNDYLQYGPSCLFLFHPGLGPLYPVIHQKIRKGRLSRGAELQLEIAEVDIENLLLEGSLLIEADPPLGTYDASGRLQYGREGRCTLKNLAIRNQGIDYLHAHHFWKNELTRHEAVKIVLYEGAEFHAEGITLEGPHLFEVPAYHRLVLKTQPDGKYVQELFSLDHPTWCWRYTFDSQNAIQLQKVKGKKREKQDSKDPKTITSKV